MMMMIAMAALTSVLSQENRVCCFEVLLPFSSSSSSTRMHNTNLEESNTDVCIGMRMLRGKNGKSEDISTCENNIQHFRSQANGIKSKLEQMEIELPFRGYYIIELAMFHNNDILHNVIHNFSYEITL